MVRVSKQKLADKTNKQIQKQFSKTLSHLGSDAPLFMEDLFTRTERVMFAKRLAALLLIAERKPLLQVHRALKMSQSTIFRLHTEYTGGAHPYIEKLMKNQEKKERIWADLEKLLRLGMPEMGRGRWKWLNEMK